MNETKQTAHFFPVPVSVLYRVTSYSTYIRICISFGVLELLKICHEFAVAALRRCCCR